MDWQSILLSVLSIVITALVSWISERLIRLINTKISNTKYAKYLGEALDVVTRAVKSTYQTYVESLKGQDMFTAEAQKEALSRAKTTALNQLSKDTQNFIQSNFGDVEAWIQESIESTLYDLKNASANNADAK